MLTYDFGGGGPQNKGMQIHDTGEPKRKSTTKKRKVPPRKDLVLKLRRPDENQPQQ